MLELRDYHASDIPKISEVIKAAFAEYQGRLEPPSSAEMKSPEVVKKELKAGNALVIEANGTIVACVFYQPKGEDVYLERLAVLPDYRKQGIATMLIREVEKRAKERRAKGLSLSVRLALTKQQAFYSSLGFKFESYGTHVGFSEPTFMIMKKRFAD